MNDGIVDGIVRLSGEEDIKGRDEKVVSMTHLRDLMVCEGAAVACAKRRDALCFVPFLSGTVFGTSAEHLREDVERRQ